MTDLSSMSDSEIASELAPYGCVRDPQLFGAIRTYIDVLLRWNHRVSLTTITSPTEILRFHIGESIFAVSTVGVYRGRLADVGSGAGLPGIPLALFSRSLDVLLIESSAKKAAFLFEVQRLLDLSNLQIFHGRFQDVDEPATGFDFVTARALGSYDRLLSWSSGRLKPSGRIVLWLGLNDVRPLSQTPGWRWQVPYDIPQSKNRVILVGERDS